MPVGGRNAHSIWVPRKTTTCLKKGGPGASLPERASNCNKRKALLLLNCFALSLSRLIGEDHSSGPGRFCREQVQSLEAIPIFEETLSTARNHRVDQENQLIQQALFQQRADEGWTSGSADVLSWLLLQPSDFLSEIALDQCRVLPCFHALQGGREDILRRGVNKARKRFIRSSRPVGGPLLIGHAPQQDSVLGG